MTIPANPVHTDTTQTARLECVTPNPAKARVDALRQLIPEAFGDGKIDWEKLRIALGDAVDVGRERYGLSWPGKAEAMRAVQRSSTGTLLPDRSESVDFEDTEHVFIEGDNLEVLKVLQKSYHGKVKLIYIDPPYNTGKEFVYPDNYREGLEDYLKFSGQVGEGGARVSANTETGGRYHSKWLSMMWPRLFMARNLLREDGVIFVSIDDHEVDNLRAMMDEVFGSDNFVAGIAWQNLDTTKNDATLFSDNHEYILGYARDKAKVDVVGIKKTEKQRAYYKNLDDDPRGDYLLTPLHAKSGSDTSVYEYTFSNGQTWRPPPGTYPRYSKMSLAQLEKDDRIYLDDEGANVPQKKTFWTDVGDRMPPPTFWDYSTFGSTRQSNKELARLVGKGVFQNPKPTKLIATMIDIMGSPGGIVLDFFAGSGTTGHAVAQLNSADSDSKRRYILVQLPEPIDPKEKDQKCAAALCDKLGKPRNIATLARERLRRAGKEIAAGNGMFTTDLGFRAFRLTTSNFRTWDADNAPTDPAALAKQIELLTDNLDPARDCEALLFEILLRRGIELSVRITPFELAGVTWHTVHEGAIWICPGRHMARAAFDAVLAHEPRPQEIIVLDQAFDDDQTKANVVQQFLDTAISQDGDLKSPRRVDIKIL